MRPPSSLLEPRRPGQNGFSGGQLKDRGRPKRTNLLPTKDTWGLPAVTLTLAPPLPHLSPPRWGPGVFFWGEKGRPVPRTYVKQMKQ